MLAFEDFSPLKKLAPNIIGKQIFQFLIFRCVNIQLRYIYIYIYILIWWISQKNDIRPTLVWVYGGGFIHEVHCVT